MSNPKRWISTDKTSMQGVYDERLGGWQGTTADTNATDNRRDYLDDLKRRQREHLDSIGEENWQPCMHDGCSECIGTGVKKDGSTCIHWISCPCPRCTPRF